MFVERIYHTDININTSTKIDIMDLNNEIFESPFSDGKRI